MHGRHASIAVRRHRGADILQAQSSPSSYIKLNWNQLCMLMAVDTSERSAKVDRSEVVRLLENQAIGFKVREKDLQLFRDAPYVTWPSLSSASYSRIHPHLLRTRRVSHYTPLSISEFEAATDRIKAHGHACDRAMFPVLRVYDNRLRVTQRSFIQLCCDPLR